MNFENALNELELSEMPDSELERLDTLVPKAAIPQLD